MKALLSEVRQIVQEELHKMIDEIVSKEVPNGTSWKLAGRAGWGAKNANGVTNYYYGKDEARNKEKADEFRHDSTRKKSEFLKKEAGVLKAPKASKPTSSKPPKAPKHTSSVTRHPRDVELSPKDPFKKYKVRTESKLFGLSPSALSSYIKNSGAVPYWEL